MKAKTFKKKLELNKKTVANLNVAEMNGLRGGTAITCGEITCDETCEGCYYEESLVCWTEGDC